eukprot:11179617-Lingulodinium_polyedra.AAC.1
MTLCGRAMATTSRRTAAKCTNYRESGCSSCRSRRTASSAGGMASTRRYLTRCTLGRMCLCTSVGVGCLPWSS